MDVQIHRRPQRAIEMHPCLSRGVPSTLIAGFGYDPDELVLYVDFRDGSRWRYLGVTAERFQRFIASESKGAHFRAEIRGKHDAEEM